jgi:hypothetical protein
LLPAVICQYSYPRVQAIREGATERWRKMERESHKTLRHQPHPFLAKGDFEEIGKRKVQEIEKLFPVDSNTRKK